MPPALVRHYLSKIVNTPQLLKRFSKKPRVGDRDLLWGQRFDVLQRSLPTVSVLIVNVGVFVSNLLLRVNQSFLDWQTCRFSVRLSKATTESWHHGKSIAGGWIVLFTMTRSSSAWLSYHKHMSKISTFSASSFFLASSFCFLFFSCSWKQVRTIAPFTRGKIRRVLHRMM